MGDLLEKSKKQFDGSPERSPRDDFVLFLDENLHNCAPILEVLKKSGVQYERHGTHFNAGELDTAWLPHICGKRWILLTKDKGIRYNQLEISAILTNDGREFFFRSGNWTGSKMAEILAKALGKMKRMANKLEPPFIASLTENGEVFLRFDKNGSIYEQKRKSKKELK